MSSNNGVLICPKFRWKEMGGFTNWLKQKKYNNNKEETNWIFYKKINSWKRKCKSSYKPDFFFQK